MGGVHSLRPHWLKESAASVLALALCICGMGDTQSRPAEATTAVIAKEAADLEELVQAKEYTRAAELAVELWKSVEHRNITPEEIPRLTHALTLVADLYLGIYGDQPRGIRVLKTAIARPDARASQDNDKATIFEWAAARLGKLYYDAGCQRSATYWLQQALDFSQSRNLPGHTNQVFIIEQLWLLANAQSFLGKPSEGLRYNRRMLDLVGENPTSHAGVKVLAQVGHSELLNGDFNRGTRLLDKFRHNYRPSTADELIFTVEIYLAEGYAQLAKGNYDAVAQLTEESVKLLETTQVASDDIRPEFVHAVYGLRARALIKQAHYEEALTTISSIYPQLGLDTSYDPTTLVDNIELLGDLARIYVHTGQFAKAFPAYILLARHYGQLVADYREGKTPRLRLFWLYRESAVVQELTSVWLSIPASNVKNEWEPEVANALLQTKANLFLALTYGRSVTYREWEGLENVLFGANRSYAKAARKVWDDPTDQHAWFDLEDAFINREDVEERMTGGPFDLIPSLARVFAFDFRELFDSDKTALLDYSLIDFTYPRNAQRQPSNKRLYVGVKLARGLLRVIDLGEEEELSAKVRPFLEDVSQPPRGGDAVARVLKDSAAAYHVLISPFGQIPDTVYLAPEGFLSSVPFQALVNDGHFLIENHRVWFNHSLLLQETIRHQQQSGHTANMYFNRAVVLIGDPDYAGTRYVSLPGTRKELETIQQLFSRRAADPETRDLNVVAFTAAEATVQAIRSSPHPLVLHIASHAEFWPGDRLLQLPQMPGVDNPLYWEAKPEPELMEGPLGGLDEGLLRSSLVLSLDSSAPASASANNERRVTALELSSLNLLGCDILVLSACETGLGTESRGAGVLGFQYAIQTTMARHALVSLWNVSDEKSASVISTIYENWLIGRHTIPDSYTLALRHLCRDQDIPVHPFYWAPFILIDQSY